MSAEPINPRVVVSPKAKLGKGVQVGAFAVVGADVELGEGCMVHDHAVVQGPAKFGAGNVFHPFCAIGGDPQDYTYAGEHVELAVGDKNIFREYVTISLGTKKAAARRGSAAIIFFWRTRTWATTARSAAGRCS